MMRAVFFLLLVLVSCSPLPAQVTTGDVLMTEKSATGKLVEKWITKTPNKVIGWNGSGVLGPVDGGGGGGGSGTVTSVALSLPGVFSVTGSPVTTSGTLTAALASQSANRVWAGPATGSAAAPTFRALVAADVPDLSGVYQPLITDGALTIARTFGLQAALDTKLSSSTAASTYQPLITAGTTAQYWRGDKSWQTLDATAVGLGAVPNVDATNMSNASAGLLAQTYGGLGVDVSGQTGFIKLNGSTVDLISSSVGGFGSADSAKLPVYDSGGSLTAASFIAYTTAGTQTALKPGSIDFFNNAKTMQLKPPAAIVGSFALTLPNISANATLVSTNDSGTVTNAMLAGSIADAKITSASTWNSKESALTFSTGLTRATNTITVNTSQNIATLSNLTTNGVVTTTGGTGALSITGTSADGVANKIAIYGVSGDLTAAQAIVCWSIGGVGTYPYTALTSTTLKFGGSSTDGILQTETITPGTTRTWTMPNATGTIITTGNLSSITAVGTLASGSVPLSLITGLGTGIPAALAINTGSAGAPVLFNGALGTPSSGTLTNCTVKAEIVVACSDETTSLTTGTAKVTFRMPHAMVVSSVRLQVNTAPTGSVIIVDVREAGTTIFSTKPQIATSAFTSVGGAVPGVLSDTALADDAEITINLDQIGSTIAGKGLKITLVGTRQ
jgi:hypothetical protein